MIKGAIISVSVSNGIPIRPMNPNVKNAGKRLGYYHGDKWHDLCRGPHLVSSGKIGKAFKLTKVSGAYWRGNSKNEMLQKLICSGCNK